MWVWCSGSCARRSPPSKAPGVRLSRYRPAPKTCSAAARGRRPPDRSPPERPALRLGFLRLAEVRVRLVLRERGRERARDLRLGARLRQDESDGGGRFLREEPNHADGRALPEDRQEDRLVVHGGHVHSLLVALMEEHRELGLAQELSERAGGAERPGG